MPPRRPIANHNQAPAANDTGVIKLAAIAADHVQPFMLEMSGLRGRMVRLNDAVHTIIGHHAYPPPVAYLLAEALSLTALLAGMLKFEGIFTLQLKGNGPVSMVVCDLTTKGHLRGYASFDAVQIAALQEDRILATPPALTELCGDGYLAFTVDQKNNTDRYQGIVELSGERLSDAVRHYFQQSEQIKTGFEIAVGQSFGTDAKGNDQSHWHGAALMVQQVATLGGHVYGADPVEEEVLVEPASEVTLDNWRRTMLLLNTASPAEMLDAQLPVTDVLYRLFHEEGVRVFDPLPIIAKCRCNRKKIAAVIDPLPLAEKHELAEQGKITVICEFCNKHYRFRVEPLDKPSK